MCEKELAELNCAASRTVEGVQVCGLQHRVQFLASPYAMLFGNFLKAIVCDFDRMMDCLPDVSCNK
jgi:hypothetical protein